MSPEDRTLVAVAVSNCLWNYCGATVATGTVGAETEDTAHTPPARGGGAGGGSAAALFAAEGFKDTVAEATNGRATAKPQAARPLVLCVMPIEVRASGARESDSRSRGVRAHARACLCVCVCVCGAAPSRRRAEERRGATRSGLVRHVSYRGVEDGGVVHRLNECITPHCIALHCITLHCIALHYTTLHYITLHYVTFRSRCSARRRARCTSGRSSA